jgi:O-antigen/teichoic acid export membrane protein
MDDDSSRARLGSDEEIQYAHSRNRALRRTLISSAGFQAVTAVGTLVSLPFVTRALSGSEFGVVATLTGFQALLGLADFGVGSALTFAIAELRARGDSGQARRLVASGLTITGASALVVLGVGYLAAVTVPWSALLNTGSMPNREVALAVAATATTIAVSIVGSLGYRVLFALQRGSTVGWTMLGAASLSMLMTIIVSQSEPRAYAIVLTMLGVPALTSALMTVLVLGRVESGALRPHLADATREGVTSLVRRSRWFWLISLAGAAAFQTDTLIVAGFTTAATAGGFAIVLRLFGLVNQTIQPWILQLGPAFADALARGHVQWVKARLVRSTVIALSGSAAAGAGLVLVAPTVVSAWLGPDLAPTRSLLVPAALWTTVILSAEPMFLLLQALGRLRFHATAAWVMALMNIGLSVWFTWRWGASGPLWGSFASSVVCIAVPGYLAVRPFLGARPEPVNVNARDAGQGDDANSHRQRGQM